MPALRAATAGSRALGSDGQKIRALARDLFDAAARHRTELVHTPFYGVRCVILQTSAPTRSIHANCGRATPRGEAHASLRCLLQNVSERETERELEIKPLSIGKNGSDWRLASYTSQIITRV